jgi:threonylcarbamoyladenosine tRNA methylthiotransferase MtaB
VDRVRRRLSVLTVGCKSSFADSATIVKAAAMAGFEIVPAGDEADVVFVNGCTVTHRADRDNRALVRRTRRRLPGAVLVMSGCFPATADDEIRRGIPEVDHWLPAGQDVAPLLNSLSGEGFDGYTLTDYAADRLLGHKRTFLKIQDGCDARCAYCIVPVARGGHRSEPLDSIVGRAVESECDGASELLLTGIHIGRYGTDRGESDGLATLVRTLLARTRRPRIRLGSVEPLELSKELLALFGESPRLCPHLHVPLQSGSDALLRKMRRPYAASQFVEAVGRAREANPAIRIGADVLVGFPGESAADFEATREAVIASGIDYLHVFPYSARPGAESARWKDDVPSTEKKARVAELARLDRTIRDRFLAGRVGTIVEVLVQRSDPAAGTASGVTEFGVDARFPGPSSLLCATVGVRVEGMRDGCLTGRLGGPHA